MKWHPSPKYIYMKVKLCLKKYHSIRTRKAVTLTEFLHWATLRRTWHVKLSLQLRTQSSLQENVWKSHVTRRATLSEHYSRLLNRAKFKKWRISISSSHTLPQFQFLCVYLMVQIQSIHRCINEGDRTGPSGTERTLHLYSNENYYILAVIRRVRETAVL